MSNVNLPAAQALIAYNNANFGGSTQAALLQENGSFILQEDLSKLLV